MATILTISYLLLLMAGTVGIVAWDHVERRRREPAEQIRAAVSLGLREIDAIAAGSLQELRARAEQSLDVRDSWERW